MLHGALLVCLGFTTGTDVFAQARKEISPQHDFRVNVAAVSLTRHVGLPEAFCDISLDVAWDKRLTPLLVQNRGISITFAKDAKGATAERTTPAQDPLTVGGRNHHELALRVPAPARSSPQIDVLKGQLLVTTPSKRLAFVFDSLKMDRPIKKTMAGVSVTLEKVTAGPDRLSVELIINNPQGTPAFETFQTNEWIEYNTIAVEKAQGNVKQTLSRHDSDVELLDALTPTRARIRYHFAMPKDGSFGKLEDWRLVYQTPGPIVEVVVPFELKNIALP